MPVVSRVEIQDSIRQAVEGAAIVYGHTDTFDLPPEMARRLSRQGSSAVSTGTSHQVNII